MKTMKYLDSWRGIGCLMVFASHILDSLFGCGTFFGKSGVAILFSLSAYLLCELYYWRIGEINKKWCVNFYKKRIVRVFPPLIFTCLVAVFVHFMTVETAVRQCLMLEQYSHFWVLPLEMTFYLMFPIIVKLMKKAGRQLSILTWGTIISVIWCYYLFFAVEQNTGGIIYCLPLFALGILVSLISHEKISWIGGVRV